MQYPHRPCPSASSFGLIILVVVFSSLGVRMQFRVWEGSEQSQRVVTWLVPYLALSRPLQL